MRKSKALTPIQENRCFIPVKSYQRVVDVLWQEFPEDLMAAGILCLQLYCQLNKMHYQMHGLEPPSEQHIAQGAVQAILSMKTWVKSGDIQFGRPANGGGNVAGGKRRRRPAAGQSADAEPGKS